MRGLRRWLVCGLIAQGTVALDHALSYSQEIAENTSLRLVPKDADLYVGSYNQSEQWQAFLNGPVAKKFLSLRSFRKTGKRFWLNGTIAMVKWLPLAWYWRIPMRKTLWTF